MAPNPDRVLIFDTTLRDGEQSPGCSMTQPEKLRVARALAELGVDVIEAGFPAASRGDWEAVSAVAREVHGVHDVSDGGLAVALAEMAIEGGCGFDVALGSDLTPALAWFSETASRVVVSVDAAGADELVDRARAANVPAQRLGTAGGDRLAADGAFSVALVDATHAWRDALPAALGHPTPDR